MTIGMSIGISMTDAECMVVVIIIVIIVRVVGCSTIDTAYITYFLPLLILNLCLSIVLNLQTLLYTCIIMFTTLIAFLHLNLHMLEFIDDFDWILH